VDECLRNAERQSDRNLLFAQLVRSGRVTPDSARLLAVLGYSPACQLTSIAPATSRFSNAWLRSLTSFGDQIVAAAMVLLVSSTGRIQVDGRLRETLHGFLGENPPKPGERELSERVRDLAQQFEITSWARATLETLAEAVGLVGTGRTAHLLSLGRTLSDQLAHLMGDTESVVQSARLQLLEALLEDIARRAGSTALLQQS